MSDLPPHVIRAYVDGEETSPDAASIAQQADSDPELARQIAFEKALRERVGRAMETGPAPEALHEQVAAAIGQPDVVGRVDEDGARSNRGWLAGPCSLGGRARLDCAGGFALPHLFCVPIVSSP